MDRNGPVWCRDNIDILTERVAQNAASLGERVTTVSKIGLTFIIGAAIRRSEGNRPTLLQRVAINIAKRWNMTLDEQIKQVKAEIEAAKQRQEMALAERGFNRDSFELINDMRLKWIDKQMQVEKHVAEMRKLNFEQDQREEVAKFHRGEMTRLKKRRQILQRTLKQSNRKAERAERIYEGGTIKTAHRISCWRSFGELLGRSRLMFEPMADSFFQRVEVNEWERVEIDAEPMTLRGLIEFCVRNQLMVDTSSKSFDVIDEAFNEIQSNQLRIADALLLEIDETQKRLTEVNEAQRPT